MGVRRSTGCILNVCAVSFCLADTYAGGKGSLHEPVCRERLASCLRDAIAPSGALVAKMLPGIFSDGAPQDIQDEQSTIMSEFHPVGFRLISISSAQTDTRDLLPRIQVRTLLLWGDLDRRSPVHVAEQLHAAIPGAELAVIPEAGRLSNIEQPEVFNVHVRRLLSEPRPRVTTSRIVMSINSISRRRLYWKKPVSDRGTSEDVSQSP
jgi:pimeloyl-ACP methyl ester carboxylesterase